VAVKNFGGVLLLWQSSKANGLLWRWGCCRRPSSRGKDVEGMRSEHGVVAVWPGAVVANGRVQVHSSECTAWRRDGVGSEDPGCARTGLMVRRSGALWLP
jgi:hypothetical protein